MQGAMSLPAGISNNDSSRPWKLEEQNCSTQIAAAKHASQAQANGKDIKAASSVQKMTVFFVCLLAVIHVNSLIATHILTACVK